MLSDAFRRAGRRAVPRRRRAVPQPPQPLQYRVKRDKRGYMRFTVLDRGRTILASSGAGYRTEAEVSAIISRLTHATRFEKVL